MQRELDVRFSSYDVIGGKAILVELSHDKSLKIRFVGVFCVIWEGLILLFVGSQCLRGSQGRMSTVHLFFPEPVPGIYFP